MLVLCWKISLMHLQKRSWSYGTRVLLAVADVVGATLRDLRLHLHMRSALGYIAEATKRRKYDHIKGLRLEEKNNRTILSQLATHCAVSYPQNSRLDQTCKVKGQVVDRIWMQIQKNSPSLVRLCLPICEQTQQQTRPEPPAVRNI